MTERPLTIWISQGDFDYLGTLQVHTGQPISAVVHTLIERTRGDRQPPGKEGSFDERSEELLAVIAELSAHIAALLGVLRPVVPDTKTHLAMRGQAAALLMRIRTAAPFEKEDDKKE